MHVHLYSAVYLHVDSHKSVALGEDDGEMEGLRRGRGQEGRGLEEKRSSNGDEEAGG